MVDKKLKEDAAKVRAKEKKILNAAKKLTEQRRQSIQDMFEEFRCNMAAELQKELAEYQKEMQELYDEVTTPKRTRKKRKTKAQKEKEEIKTRLLTLNDHLEKERERAREEDDRRATEWVEVPRIERSIPSDDTLTRVMEGIRRLENPESPRRGRPRGTTKKAAVKKRRARPKSGRY